MEANSKARQRKGRRPPTITRVFNRRYPSFGSVTTRHGKEHGLGPAHAPQIAHHLPLMSPNSRFPMKISYGNSRLSSRGDWSVKEEKREVGNWGIYLFLNLLSFSESTWSLIIYFYFFSPFFPWNYVDSFAPNLVELTVKSASRIDTFAILFIQSDAQNVHGLLSNFVGLMHVMGFKMKIQLYGPNECDGLGNEQSNSIRYAGDLRHGDVRYNYI